MEGVILKVCSALFNSSSDDGDSMKDEVMSTISTEWGTVATCLLKEASPNTICISCSLPLLTHPPTCVDGNILVEVIGHELKK